MVLKWIATAWAQVPTYIIERSFLTTGISNAIDGKEDHLILAHMRDGGEVEVADDVHTAPEVEEWVNPLFATAAEDAAAAEAVDHEDCGDLPPEEEEEEDDEDEDEEEELDMEGDVEEDDEE
ncbi:unnamed protein product [Closterium sp. NIES-54]